MTRDNSPNELSMMTKLFLSFSFFMHLFKAAIELLISMPTFELYNSREHMRHGVFNNVSPRGLRHTPPTRL